MMLIDANYLKTAQPISFFFHQKMSISYFGNSKKKKKRVKKIYAFLKETRNRNLQSNWTPNALLSIKKEHYHFW